MRDSFLVMVIIPVLGVTAILGVGAFWLDGVSCRSRWEGFEPTYSVTAGCRIVHEGRRIPTEMLRELAD